MEIIRELKVANFSAADCSWCETEAWCNSSSHYDRGTSKDMLAWKAGWAKYGCVAQAQPTERKLNKKESERERE